MSEAGDFDPGAWRGHDFGSARTDYDRHAGRSYQAAVDDAVDATSLVPEMITFETEAGVVVVTDVTGSMKKSPKTVFSKCGYLELEAQEYFGASLSFCFAAFGDAYTDRYPLQVRPPVSGTAMLDELKELKNEGGGGNQTHETSELAAVYFARNVKMPNMIRKPVLILVTDEHPYDFVNKDQAKKYAHVLLQKRLSTVEVFEELMEKFSVYIVVQPYSRSASDELTGTNALVYNKWVSLVGEDRVSILPEAERFVDVAFGIFAAETGRVDYFEEEIEERQTAAQVATVYKSLKTIHRKTTPKSDPRKKEKTGKSVMLRPSDGKKTKSLL